MTPKQSAILDYIRACDTAGEPAPTLREIGDAVGISSTSVVSYEVDALVSAGHIRRDRMVSRGIRLAGENGVGGKLAEVVKITTQLAEIVRLHEVQVADLQAEVQRLGRIVEAFGER